MKRQLKLVIFSQICSVLTWFILSVVGAVGSALLSGQIFLISAFGLGISLACLGAFVHTVLIGFNLQPAWWKLGGVFALLLGSTSLGLGTIAGDRYPFAFVATIYACLFMFSAFIYIFIQRNIVELILDE